MFTIFLSQEDTVENTQSQGDSDRDQWLRDCPIILAKTTFCWINPVTQLVVFYCFWTDCLTQEFLGITSPVKLDLLIDYVIDAFGCSAHRYLEVPAVKLPVVSPMAEMWDTK